MVSGAILGNGIKKILFIFLAAGFLFSSCDYGQLGSADRTDTYQSGSEVFEERLGFLSGVWYSHDPGIGRLDGYRIREWGSLSAGDKAKAEALFPALNADSPLTCSSRMVPQSGDYVFLYDDTVLGQQDDNPGAQESWGFSYMALVRAINIFNNDKDRGAVIIEYFEGAEPLWLSETQDLERGVNPFFGIYYRVLSADIVQMANPVDQAAKYAGENYYTEKGSLEEAVSSFSVENEAEFISWGVAIPQNRER